MQSIFLMLFIAWLLLDIVRAVLLRNSYDPRCIWERLFDRLLGRLATRLNRKDRADNVLFVRGVVMIGVAILLAFPCIFALPYVPYLPLVFLCLGVSGTGWVMTTALPDIATQAVLYQAPLIKADDSTRRRLAIQAMVRSLCDTLLMPVALYMVGAWYFIPTWAAMAWIVHAHGMDGHGSAFTHPARALYVPLAAVVQFGAGIILALAAWFAPRLNPARILTLPFRTFKRASVVMGGLPLSVLAVAMNRTLGGARQHKDGTPLANPWTGGAGATAQLDANDWNAARYAFAVTCVLVAIIVSLYLKLPS